MSTVTTPMMGLDLSSALKYFVTSLVHESKEMSNSVIRKVKLNTN
jgi:hypothetical protein